MKNSSILTKERLLIILAGFVLLLAGGVYRFYPAVSDFFGADQTAAQKMQRIRKFQLRVSRLSLLEERVLFLTRSAEKASFLLLPGTSPDMAGVAIQNMLRDMAAAGDINFQSLTVMKPDTKTWENITVISVKAVFTATIRQVKDFLYRSETAPKLLSVTELRIAKPGNREGENLNIAITLQGYMNTGKVEGGA